MKLRLLLLLPCFFLLANAIAHNPGQSYIYFSTYTDRVEGDIQAKAEEWNKALGTNLPKKFTKEEMMAVYPQMQQYILEHLDISSNLGQHKIVFMEPDAVTVGERLGSFSLIKFKLEGISEIPKDLEVDYSLFFENDKKHRALLLQAYNWKAGIINNESVHSGIFTPTKTRQKLNLAKGTTWNGFVSMVKMGVWHIWIGIDHIFFLLALLFPAVVSRLPNRKSLKEILTQWKGVDAFKPAFWYILKVVTFFTIAHTITLSLAALKIVSLPSHIVEAVIAFSIALAAFHNIKPIFNHKEWLVAFGFGLFHGFGFAGVLAEKGLSGEFMVLSLFGFNLGVEIGQVLIILAVFPILFLLRKTKLYSPFVIFASIVLIILSLIWTFERLFDFNVPISQPFRWLIESIT